MKRKPIFIILIIFFAGVMVFSGWKLYQILHNYQVGEHTYETLEQYVSLPDADADTGTDDTAWPEVDFAALREINPDIVGWIFIEGTEINYPVVQGANNDTYLTRMFDGASNGAGCIFLDDNNAADLSDQHSVIYGHHMKNGSMFAGLSSYKTQEFYDEHPTALLLTPTQNYKLQLFSGYVASVQDDAWKLTFDGDNDFEGWLARAVVQSCFESPVTPTEHDHVVTLSTCSYEFQNARFVVHGILK